MSSTLQRPGARRIAGLCLAGLTAAACATAPPRGRLTPAQAPGTASVPAAQAVLAQPSADRVWTGFALGMYAGRGTASAAHIQADLIRRLGGEWVIVNLTSRGPKAGRAAALPALPPSAAATPTADDTRVRAVLREYEQAFERRDAVRLARVWVMNPAERSRVQRLFNRSKAIAVSIRGADVVVDGNRASLAFDQRFVVSSQRGGSGAHSRALRRALGARDSLGNWTLEDVSGAP